MSSKQMLLSLIPWVVFSIIVERSGADAAGIAAIAAGAISAFFLNRKRRTGIKSIDLAGFTTFVIIAVLAFAGDDAVRRDVVNYGRGTSTLILALVMLVSVWTVPFTEQYARDEVPRQYWSSPVFRSLNRRLSLAWALLILAMSASRLSFGRLASTGHGPFTMNILLNWIIPAALTFVALFYTKRVAGPSDAAQPSTAEAV